MGSQNKGSREGPRESGWEGCLQVGGLREPLGVRRSRSEGAGGLRAAGATVQSVLCGAPCPPRTGQNIGLRVGALAGGSGLRTPSLLCRQGSSVWARPGAMMPAGEQRLAGPGHLPVVPGEETQSPPVPPSTWLPLWDPRIQIGSCPTQRCLPGALKGWWSGSPQAGCVWVQYPAPGPALEPLPLVGFLGRKRSV